MNAASIIILALVALAVGLVIFSMVRNNRKGSGSCGCSCSSCPLSGNCGKKIGN